MTYGHGLGMDILRGHYSAYHFLGIGPRSYYCIKVIFHMTTGLTHLIIFNSFDTDLLPCALVS